MRCTDCEYVVIVYRIYIIFRFHEIKLNALVEWIIIK